MKKGSVWWIVFFILIALGLGAFWTTSNVYIYQKYSHLVDELRTFSGSSRVSELSGPLTWMSVFLGLGFGLALVGLGVFFFRLLREMQLSQLQKDFFARISHELQSPVSSLELSGALLRRRDQILNSEEEQSLWDVHDSELKRLRVEIESLLEASRWENKGFKPDLNSIDFESWLSGAFSGWEKILGPSGKIRRVGESLDIMVRLDPRVMSLVTNNLVDNSRKFSKGQKIEIEFRTNKTQLENGGILWSLEFKDNGLGFAPEMSEKIFKKFERVGERGQKSGYGLGLFLVHQACRQMGMEVVASSQGMGQGACFKISGFGEMKL